MDFDACKRHAGVVRELFDAVVKFFSDVTITETFDGIIPGWNTELSEHAGIHLWG